MKIPPEEGFDRNFIFLDFLTCLGFDFIAFRALVHILCKNSFHAFTYDGRQESLIDNFMFKSSIFENSLANRTLGNSLNFFKKNNCPIRLAPFTLSLGNIANPVNASVTLFINGVIDFQLIRKVFCDEVNTTSFYLSWTED